MIVIDSDNYAEHGIETMFFPGGEPHVKVPPLQDKNILLFLKLRKWDDVGFAALLIDALTHQYANMRVFIPYVPGARQDRSAGDCGLTLWVTGAILGRTHVRVFDPHSRATFTHFRVLHTYMPADLLPARRGGVVGIIAPDAGAVDRAKHFRDAIYPERPLITATKQRDSASGRLSNYALPPLQREGHYIVVDDICDGGGTFNLLAEAIARDPMGKTSSLELLVSHGIFSKGLDAISPRYTHITTTDSWCRLPSSDRLTVLPLAELFPTIMNGEYSES